MKKMVETVLGKSLAMLAQLGLYDIVLPLLLTFTIMYAILDKTRILGTDTINDKKHPKRNLNATAAIVIAFLVVASSRLVEAITAISSQVVVLLLLAVFFLVLVGTVYKEGELNEDGLKEGWARNIFIGVMLVGIAGIALNAIKTPNGVSWLKAGTSFLANNWGNQGVATILLVLGMIGFIMLLTAPSKDKGKGKEKDK